MSMDIALIGGAGYVESNLVKDLVDRFGIIVIDRYNSGKTNSIRFIQADASVKDLTDIMSSCEAVIHLASESDVRKVGSDNHIDLDITSNIVDCSISAGLRKVMYFSSSAVYGDNGWGADEQTICEPISQYGLMKLESERLLSSSKLESIVLRPSNICGRSVTHGVVFDFVNQLTVHSDHMDILGNGLQTKEFVHVSDVIDFVKICLDSWISGTYNVSNGDPLSIIDLAGIVVESMGLNDVKINVGKGDRGWKGDVSRCHLICDRALSIGWSPKYSSKRSVEDAVMCMISGDGGPVNVY